MSEGNILSIWNTLAAILEIGNIIFTDEETPQGTVAKVENFEQCRLSAQLLNVTPESLQATLTERVMTARGESYTISLNSKDALNARNAICKAMYSAVFSSLVDVINVALAENMSSMDSSQYNSIGVLDIFGFESFQHNEFEQVVPLWSFPSHLSLPRDLYSCSSTMPTRSCKMPSIFMSSKMNCDFTKRKISQVILLSTSVPTTVAV